jgi:hypothetical protein
MLISVRETVELGEGVERRFWGEALVRLLFLYQFLYRLWNSSDQWAAFYLEFAGVGEDRKLSLSPVSPGGCVDGMIEGRA